MLGRGRGEEVLLQFRGIFVEWILRIRVGLKKVARSKDHDFLKIFQNCKKTGSYFN